MTAKGPTRGEIWLVDLNPIRGHEQAGKRPCLIVSVDLFNQSPAELVIVLPISTKGKGIRTHVRIDPPEAGTRETCFIKCEDVRSISTERLIRRWGHVSSGTVQAVEDRQGMMISCVEEIAYHMGYINEETLHKDAAELASNGYGQYLLRFLDGLHK